MKAISANPNISFREVFFSELKRDSKKIKFFLFFYTLAGSFLLMSSISSASNGIAMSQDNLVKVIIGLAGSNAPLISALLTSSAISPFLAASAVGFLGRFGSSLNLPIQPSLLSNTFILTTTTIFAITGFIINAPKASKLLGLAVMEKIERIYGQAQQFLIPILAFVGSTGVLTAYACTYPGTLQGIAYSPKVFYISLIVSFVVSLVSSIVFYIVKTVVLFFDIMDFLFSVIPGSSLAFGIIKNGLAGFLVFINAVNPVMGFAINVVIIAICFLLFKRAYITVVYFRHIYILPFLKKLSPFKREALLVHKKLPKKILKHFEGTDIALAIPVFPIIRFPYIKGVWKKEKCWLVSAQKENYIFKHHLFKKPTFFNIKSTINTDIVLQSKWLFFEIYGNEEIKKGKKLSFVFSKEYKSRLNEILQITSFIDYETIKQASNAEKEMEESQNILKKLWFMGRKEKDNNVNI